MFTAYDAETDKYIPVKPIAVDASSVLYKRVPHETLFIADAKTGRGIRLSTDTPYFGGARHAQVAIRHEFMYTEC